MVHLPIDRDVVAEVIAVHQAPAHVHLDMNICAQSPAKRPRGPGRRTMSIGLVPRGLTGSGPISESVVKWQKCRDRLFFLPVQVDSLGTT